MSFPDFINDDQPETLAQKIGEDFTEMREGNGGEFQQMDNNDQDEFVGNIGEIKQHNVDYNAMTNNNYALPEVDEEEQKRIEARQIEDNERRQKITSKMELELKVKSENKEKAIEYGNDFNSKRQEVILKRHQNNGENENDITTSKNGVKEGKKNPWALVTENVTIKETEYKGTKDVTRMRQVIVNRKNDPIPEKSK